MKKINILEILLHFSFTIPMFFISSVLFTEVFSLGVIALVLAFMMMFTIGLLIKILKDIYKK